jgi:hypothetical protein
MFTTLETCLPISESTLSNPLPDPSELARSLESRWRYRELRERVQIAIVSDPAELECAACRVWPQLCDRAVYQIVASL